MAILGLVIERPDSASAVGVRLAERFPHARFARSSAHNNLPSLERQGLVRLVRDGEHGVVERYEATPLGVQRFEHWLHASTTALPALRDALRTRLEHVSDEADLATVIDAVREQEQACVAEGNLAHSRLQAAERSRLFGPAEDDLRAIVQRALMVDEVMLWATRTRRLQRLRECLEDRGEEELTSDDVGAA